MNNLINELTMNEYKVYSYIKECKDKGLYPHLKDISKHINRCIGDVNYIINKLEDKKVISHIKSRPNVYTILK